MPRGVRRVPLTATLSAVDHCPALESTISRRKDRSSRSCAAKGSKITCSFGSAKSGGDGKTMIATGSSRPPIPCHSCSGSFMVGLRGLKKIM